VREAARELGISASSFARLVRAGSLTRTDRRGKPRSDWNLLALRQADGRGRDDRRPSRDRPDPEHLGLSTEPGEPAERVQTAFP
jgi:hypothetical protein